MTLDTFIGLSSLLSVANIQSAYDDIVKKIRLHPAAFPVYVNDAARVGGFTYPAVIVGTESEVALKEIVNFEGVTLTDDFNEAYEPGDLLIGTDDIDSTFGFAGTGIDDPEIMWSGTDIAITNGDIAAFWMVCYPYPYFVTYGSPYEYKHVYDIQDMIDLYGDDNLTVDPALMYPVLARALEIAFQHTGSVVLANSAGNFAMQYVSMYNGNPDLYETNHEPGGSQLTQSDIVEQEE